MSNITPAQEFDTSGTDAPVCPYCGHEQTDVWEYDASEGYGVCGKCGADFTYRAEVAIYYTTEKYKDEP